MQVILIQDVNNLGGANELVTVKNGYGRNYLIPKKFAVEASPSNMKQMEEKLKQQAKKEAKLLAEVNNVIAVQHAFTEGWQIVLPGAATTLSLEKGIELLGSYPDGGE